MNRDVCLVNPFRCKIMHKKAVFEMFTDEERQDWFTISEKEAIRSTAPWIRRVSESKGHAQRAEDQSARIHLQKSVTPGSQTERRLRRTRRLFRRAIRRARVGQRHRECAFSRLHCARRARFAPGSVSDLQRDRVEVATNVR